MLKDRTALVTGSTSGIGLGIARSFAEQGANVILNGFGEAAAIETLIRELTEKSGVAIRYDAADMSRPDAIESMMGRALAEFGAVDLLVNNAGIQHVAPVDEFPPQKWDAILAINLSAAFHTVRLALPAMKSRRWGRVVNIASAHALEASPYKSAYVAAKHGIAGLTKAVALEVAEQGITVNAICPGYVRTPWSRSRSPTPPGPAASRRSRSSATFCSRRSRLSSSSRSSRSRRSFSFLCLDAAASITGAVVPIDGGWTAH